MGDPFCGVLDSLRSLAVLDKSRCTTAVFDFPGRCPVISPRLLTAREAGGMLGRGQRSCNVRHAYAIAKAWRSAPWAGFGFQVETLTRRCSRHAARDGANLRLASSTATHRVSLWGQFMLWNCARTQASRGDAKRIEKMQKRIAGQAVADCLKSAYEVSYFAHYFGRTSRAAAISASTAPFMSSRFRLIPWPSTIMWATRIAF